MARTKSSVTIKDLARHANVSPATVSRVLNNSGYVSEETRRRVEQAIAELSYQPDARARGLRGKPSNLVALIIPDILNVFYTSLSRAIEQNLKEQGYTMLLGVTEDSGDLYVQYLQSFWESRVDGIIYVPPARGEYSVHTRSLVTQGMPVVELNRQREVDLLDGVVADNFRGAYQATEYLINLGHERIAFIVGSPEITTGKNRIKGFQMAMMDAGLEVVPELVKIGVFSKEFGVQATQDLLKVSPRPTATFATSNRLLMGAMTVLVDHKIRVPDEISVIAFDDSEWLSFWQPPITTVDIAVEEMAMLAVQLLLRWIQEGHPPEKPRTYSLSTMLIERKSCKRVGPRPRQA
jgi:LacI family transcriptional regulator